MKSIAQSVLTLLLCLALSPAAFALTVQEAKQQGQVGEQRDGFLGLVDTNAPSEVRELVTQVNAERRQRYEAIARENGISVAQVAALAYEKAVEETQSGNYVQLPSGQWVRK